MSHHATSETDQITRLNSSLLLTNFSLHTQPNQCCLSVECFPVRQAATTGFTTPLSTTLADVLVSEDQESADEATTQSSTVLSTRSSTTTSRTSTSTSSTRRRTSTPSTTTAAVRSTSTAALVGGKAGCSEIADAGVCRANITRYFFNSGTGSCETFTYSGCGGNKK